MPRPPLRYPLAALAAFTALLVLVTTRWAPLAGLDAGVSGRLLAYGHDHPAWIGTLRAVTDAGATWVFMSAGGLLAAACLLRRAYAEAAVIGLATLVTPVVWSLLHWWLQRPRPVGGVLVLTSNGYPSGHTTHATVAGLLAVLLLWRRLGPSGRATVVCAAVVAALVIGVSRAALLAHWPADVLGGWLLGLGLAALYPHAARAIPTRGAVSSRGSAARPLKPPPSA